MTSRNDLIHCARVYLSEARRRRNQSFGFTLIAWAGNCRRKAMQIHEISAQGDLFEHMEARTI